MLCLVLIKFRNIVLGFELSIKIAYKHILALNSKKQQDINKCTMMKPLHSSFVRTMALLQTSKSALNKSFSFTRVVFINSNSMIIIKRVEKAANQNDNFSENVFYHNYT